MENLNELIEEILMLTNEERKELLAQWKNK